MTEYIDLYTMDRKAEILTRKHLQLINYVKDPCFNNESNLTFGSGTATVVDGVLSVPSTAQYVDIKLNKKINTLTQGQYFSMSAVIESSIDSVDSLQCSIINGGNAVVNFTLSIEPYACFIDKVLFNHAQLTGESSLRINMPNDECTITIATPVVNPGDIANIYTNPLKITDPDNLFAVDENGEKTLEGVVSQLYAICE